MAEADPGSFLKPGDVYEEFRIVRPLGSGGFSWVFEVTHPKYPSSVALKLSRKPVSSQTEAMRALREIRILSTFENPHVLRIFDHGMGADQRWFMVSELLRGSELTQTHDLDQPMDPVRAVRLIHEACQGLREPHEQGVVHRDIKPDNLWITPDGSVKVIDFGLARTWDMSNTMGLEATGEHMLVGTPHYAQPEQISSAKLTPASDVYSLGIILYELFTGRTPLFEDRPVSELKEEFHRQPLRWLLAHKERETVPLQRYPEGQRLPERLRELVHCALAKDPARRPPNARVLGSWLARFLKKELRQSASANLMVRYPSGHERARPIGPGLHQIGVGRGCSVELASAEQTTVYATLDWPGLGHPARLAPALGDGTVRMDGRPLEDAIDLGPDRAVDVGRYSIRIEYPG